MIVDCHTHIHPKPDGFGASRDASLKTLVREVREGPVDRAVVLAIAPEISNEFVADACRQWPDELIGFASVEPMKGVAAIEALEAAVEDMGLRGLKLHPRRQGFSVEDVTALVPLIEKAAALAVPVLFDGLPYGEGLFRTREVELVHEVAGAVPKANIILAHAGGHQLLEAMLVAKARPNVYLDISFTPHYFAGSSVERDLIFVIRKLGAQRILYGSDYPELSLRGALDEARGLLDQCRLSADDVDLILGGNAMRLLSREVL